MGKTTGRKKTDRKIPTPRTVFCTSRASASARAVCTGTTTAAKTRLWSSALRNRLDTSGSVKIRAYWVSPMKAGSRGSPSRTLWKEKPMAATNGTATNRTSSSTAGPAMRTPASPSRRSPLRGGGASSTSAGADAGAARPGVVVMVHSSQVRGGAAGRPRRGGHSSW